jgi:pimeloyl-[acyl-carrier protein] methyl ester esterase
VPSPSPLLLVLLPGLEGTGRLFARFLTEAPAGLEPKVIPYPPDRFLGYAALEELVRRELPSGRPFVLLGESFGGPLALRIAASAPPGLRAVIMASSFHTRPAAGWLRRLRPLAPAFFNLPLPAHAVRLLLGGADAPSEVVSDVQAAVSLVKGRVMAARAREALAVDGTDALRTLRVPLLFLGGTDDRLLRTGLPIEVRLLRPDAEIRMLPAPHLLLQRRPREAGHEIEGFLRRNGLLPAAQAAPASGA